MKYANPSIFTEVRERFTLKEIVEHYTGEKLVPLGSGYELESKECPGCGHRDCFRAMPHPDSPDDICLGKCFSCGKTASDGPAFLVMTGIELNNYAAAERILRDAKENGFGERPVLPNKPKLETKPAAAPGIPFPTARQQAIFDRAAAYYAACLTASPSALQYQTETRKHYPEALKSHGIGLSNGNLWRHLRKEGFTPEEAIESGLVKENGSDYFPAGSFIYTHRDIQGRACEFTMKYPEGKLHFRLRKEFRLRGIQFYGQHTLSADTRSIYLVEGENDWLSCIEGGCETAILATTGSVSRDQLSYLKKNHDEAEIITLFDTDEAGERYRDMTASYGFPALKQLVLPVANSDPDDYLKKNSCSFDEMIKACTVWESPVIDNASAPAPTDNPESIEPKEADFPRTDMGNADLLIFLSRGNLRYIKEHSAWAYYDGKYWRLFQDHLALQLTRLVSAQRLAWAEAQTDVDDEKGKKKKQALTYALSCQDQRRINPMLALASKDPRILASINDFDANPYMLGVANGVVNLKKGELLPHTADLMISKSCKANYSPNSSHSRWIGALRRALDEGSPADTAAGLVYLQKVLGMALIGKALERSLFFVHGRPGTGKSLITNTVHHILGDYSLTLSPNSLMQSHYSSNDIIMPEIVQLKGVRFALASEADDGQRFNESLLKRITGNDPVPARNVYEKAICFMPQCTLFVVGNSRPTASGSQAFWERLKVISFNNQIPREEQNSNFDQELLEEADGILSWMIEGCLAYQQQGLKETDKVRRDSAAYQAELDTISLFIDEECLLDKDGTASAPMLFLRYVDWMRENGIQPLGRTRFYEKLMERGLEKEKIRGGNVSENPKWRIKGILLRNA